MYLTAVSAAWRYSGKVTGPDSRLSSPRVIGVPVAFFGVPSAAEVSGVDVADGVAVEADDEDDDDDFDESLLLPQPAIRTPVAAIAASAPARLKVTFTCVSPRWCG